MTNTPPYCVDNVPSFVGPMKCFCGYKPPNHIGAAFLGSCYEIYVLGVWSSHNRFNILIDLIWTITSVASFCDWILRGITKLGFRSPRKGNKIPRTRNKITITSDFIKQGDTPPNSLMDSNVNPKVKITKGEGVGLRSLAHNISGVKRCRLPIWLPTLLLAITCILSV
jgi:hypothetical protein